MRLALAVLSILAIIGVGSARPIESQTYCNRSPLAHDWSNLIPAGSNPAYLPWLLNPANTSPQVEDYIEWAPHIWNVFGASRVQLREIGTTSAYGSSALFDPFNSVQFYNGTLCDFLGNPSGCTTSTRAKTFTNTIGGVRTFDIVFFSAITEGPLVYNRFQALGTAVHEFGHALGLDHPLTLETVMNGDAYPFLSRWDVDCIRSGNGTSGAYGYQARNVRSYYSTNEGQSWHSLATTIPELQSAHWSPVIAGNTNEAASAQEAYLAVWTDGNDLIHTILGNGASFNAGTERVVPSFTIWPVSVSHGNGRWVLAYVSRNDYDLYVRWSSNGTSWSGPYRPSPQDAFRGSPAIAFNAYVGEFVLAAVRRDGVNSPRLFSSTNGSSWVAEPLDPYFTNRAWFVDMSCNETTERCTLSYMDYSDSPEDPLEMRFKDLYYDFSAATWRASISGGPVGTSTAGLQSWFAPSVAHRLYETSPNNNEELVFAYMPDDLFAHLRTVQRQAAVCNVYCAWNFLQTVSGSQEISVPPTLTSGDVYSEHLLMVGSDPGL